MKKRIVLFFLLLSFIFFICGDNEGERLLAQTSPRGIPAIGGSSPAQGGSAVSTASPLQVSGGTMTWQQRDTVLQMTALENPNYDICLVFDISGSMKGILPRLKAQAEKTVDFAQPGDTLILIKFDASPRKPLVQPIATDYDRKVFFSWVNKIETTDGFGTDIKAAYYSALKELDALNSARRQKGEPICIQQIVFVSDGFEIPPEYSPFRNIGSEKSKELNELINKANQEKLINIVPVGMEFQGYSPVLKNATGQTEEVGTHQPPIHDPELNKFLQQMEDALGRKPGGGTGSSTDTVALSDYQFYIDWLSDKLTLQKGGESEGSEKNSRVYTFYLNSDFKKVQVDNISVSAVYTPSIGDLTGRISGSPRVFPAHLVPPGDKRSTVSVTVVFPPNWSFKEKQSGGTLKVTLYGDMKIDDTMTYPFNVKEMTIPVNYTIPVSKSLYLYTGLALISLIFIPLGFIYQVLVPITVTLKSGEKAMSYRLAHKGTVTIGGNADFNIDGCVDVVAEIQRRFRRFVLVEKKEGVIPSPEGIKKGMIPLKLSQGFSLNIDGSYKEMEFLPGNQEYAVQDTQEPVDTGDMEDEEFKF